MDVSLTMRENSPTELLLFTFLPTARHGDRRLETQPFGHGNSFLNKLTNQ